jgi:hypothetical protein
MSGRASEAERWHFGSRSETRAKSAEARDLMIKIVSQLCLDADRDDGVLNNELGVSTVMGVISHLSNESNCAYH